MIIDFEHHYKPYEMWQKRGGKPGEVVRIFDEDGRQIRYEFDNTYDISLHLRHMDLAGIDMAVLSMMGMATLEEAKTVNDSFAKVVAEYPQRFVGFAGTMPLQGKPALDELERAIRCLGLKGVTIRAQTEGRFLDSPELWPFYEKVSELGVPIFVHASGAAAGFDACRAPYNLNMALVREFDLALATARLCLGGVLEDFPDLKFIIGHFGGGISAVKERLDRYVSFNGAAFWQGKPLIGEPYADRFNEHFNSLYFNTAGRKIGIGSLKCALTNISPKRLLFATDYPPNFIDDPEGMKTYIAEIRKLELDRESIEAILGGNAMELLGC